jgi:lipopolysaccharide export system protein LptC
MRDGAASGLPCRGHICEGFLAPPHRKLHTARHDWAADNDGARMNRSSIATQPEEAGTHGWTVSSRPDFDRRFRAARRHSRLVRILRIAVPVIVGGGIVALSLATWLNPMRYLAKLPTGESLAISGTTITMEQPRLAGFTRDSRPYVVTAKSAAQDLLQPDRMDLKEIHATMASKDKSVVEMSAAKGLYHAKADQLFLRERIMVTSSSGFEGRLTEAVVDMRSGDIISDKPVEVKLPKGMINANRLEIAGDLVRFDRGVTFSLDGAAPAAQPVRGAKPAPGAQAGASPLQGFSQNRAEPINIKSTSLEVRDKDHQATFIDNVRVIQGDSTMQCKTLVVFYNQNDSPAAAPSGQSGGDGQQQIDRLEAKGGVVITQKDQTATGDTGLFDMKANVATLLGNVVLTQGQNVVHGDKLVIDLTTGVSRVEGGNGRVESLFAPANQPSGPPAPSAPNDARPVKDAKPPPKLN